MSDFSYANFILSKDIEIAKEFLEPNAFLLDFNDKWGCLLTETDNKFQTIANKSFSKEVMGLSEKTPVLYFGVLGGEGFGFAILHNKKIISGLDVDYSFEQNLSMNIAIEIHGESKGFELWMDDTAEFEEIAKEKYDYYLDKVFLNVNLENFTLFGFSKAAIEELKKLLTPSNYKIGPWKMEEAFMKVLCIEKFSFISWDCLSDSKKDSRIISEG